MLICLRISRDRERIRKMGKEIPNEPVVLRLWSRKVKNFDTRAVNRKETKMKNSTK